MEECRRAGAPPQSGTREGVPDGEAGSLDADGIVTEARGGETVMLSRGSLGITRQNCRGFLVSPRSQRDAASPPPSWLARDRRPPSAKKGRRSPSET